MLTQSCPKRYNEIKERGVTMRKWFVWLVVVVLLFTISGCGIETGEVPSETETVCPTTEATELPIQALDSIEYWEIVQDEILSMLKEHNLYLSATTHGYPCKQFHVEPGIATDDGKVVASGLSQEEYEKVFESVKVELHIILDKHKLAKPKTALHGCYSMVDIFFNNWFVDENKIYDNVDSRKVASYGLDLLEYYYDYEKNAYIIRDGFFPDVWSKYPVYMP